MSHPKVYTDNPFKHFHSDYFPETVFNSNEFFIKYKSVTLPIKWLYFHALGLTLGYTIQRIDDGCCIGVPKTAQERIVYETALGVRFYFLLLYSTQAELRSYAGTKCGTNLLCYESHTYISIWYFCFSSRKKVWEVNGRTRSRLCSGADSVQCVILLSFRPHLHLTSLFNFLLNGKFTIHRCTFLRYVVCYIIVVFLCG